MMVHSLLYLLNVSTHYLLPFNTASDAGSHRRDIYSSFQRYLHTIGFFKPVIYFISHLPNSFLMFRTGNQIVHFVRIMLQIIELIRVPDTMVPDGPCWASSDRNFPGESDEVVPVAVTKNKNNISGFGSSCFCRP